METRQGYSLLFNTKLHVLVFEEKQEQNIQRIEIGKGENSIIVLKRYCCRQTNQNEPSIKFFSGFTDI